MYNSYIYIYFFSQIEYYAPGLLEQIKSLTLQGLEYTKVSFTLIAEKVIEHSSATIQWLKNVYVYVPLHYKTMHMKYFIIIRCSLFRSKLSPDNLRNYAIWAFDTTHSYASQTYDWVYEKMQTLSKVPWIKSISLLNE